MIVSVEPILTSFSLALCVSAGFRLAFIQLITYNSITNIDSYIFYFSSMFFWVFCVDNLMSFVVYQYASFFFFFFLNHPISYIFAPDFRHSWLGTANTFCHTPLWIVKLIQVLQSFQLTVWTCVLFQLVIPNYLLKSLNCWPIRSACICFRNAI